MVYTSQKKKESICYPIHIVEYLNTWIQSHPNLTWPELNSEKNAEMMTKTGLNRSQLNNWIHENCSRNEKNAKQKKLRLDPEYRKKRK